jgi:SAM-dependent methyltransferase
LPTQDVPSPIDFHDPAQSRAWVENTVSARPWRPRFFDAFVSALNDRFQTPCSILELGSGPGHLAEQILGRCIVAKYGALDFSAAMHHIARERLSAFLERVHFIQRDFRSPDWTENLGIFDAVVTMQAVHEVRHTRHVVPLLTQARKLIAPGGMLLYCDHYAESGKKPAFFLERQKQPTALLDAGFSRVQMLLDAGGMALYASQNSN